MSEVELVTLFLAVKRSSLGLRDEHQSVAVVAFVDESSFDGCVTHRALGFIGPHGRNRQALTSSLAPFLCSLLCLDLRIGIDVGRSYGRSPFSVR